MKPIEPQDKVTFHREASVIQIPSGEPLIVPKGTQGTVMQTLGGTLTIQIPQLSALVRLTDNKALYPEGAPLETEAEPTIDPNAPLNKETIWEALKTCYDPEIPVNIVDLGLVYDLKIEPLPEGSHDVTIKMTLTAPGCGMGPVIAGDAQSKVLKLSGVSKANVEVVWDPPWNPSMMSRAAKKQLGFDDD